MTLELLRDISRTLNYMGYYNEILNDRLVINTSNGVPAKVLKHIFATLNRHEKDGVVYPYYDSLTIRLIPKLARSIKFSIDYDLAERQAAGIVLYITSRCKIRPSDRYLSRIFEKAKTFEIIKQKLDYLKWEYYASADIITKKDLADFIYRIKVKISKLRLSELADLITTEDNYVTTQGRAIVIYCQPLFNEL